MPVYIKKKVEIWWVVTDNKMWCYSAWLKFKLSHATFKIFNKEPFKRFKYRVLSLTNASISTSVDIKIKRIMLHCRVIETQVVSPRWHRSYGLIRRKNRRDTCARCHTAPLTSSYAVHTGLYAPLRPYTAWVGELRCFQIGGRSCCIKGLSCCSALH